MNAFQNCRNTSDLTPLYLPLQLYIKPIARLNMSIQLPNLKKLGKSISHLEIMDKLRDLIKPDEFTVLKVIKTTVEFIRFEGEVENRVKLKNVISRMDNRMIRLKDFNDLLKIRVAEWKSDFPNRNTWDDFFQNAKDMDEMKPGERPDTVYFSNLPVKWFVPFHTSHEDSTPSEKMLYRVFEKFGAIRYIDIPICDPYRSKMKNHISGFKGSVDKSDYFECYVQFKDYIGFKKTMDAFRDMKLVHKDDNEALEVDIKVDFDKSKHLTDASIKRREIVRNRLMKKVKEKEEQEKAELEEKKRKEELERQREVDLKQQKELRRKLREEKRKVKILERLEISGADEINEKIIKEEKKLLKVQRKLEAIRLVEELFARIKVDSTKNVQGCDTTGNEELKRFKNASELEVLTQREKLHHAIKGRAMLRNILSEGKKRRCSSESSLSLEETDTSDQNPVMKKYPELLYDPAWFGLRYHLPPGSIFQECSEFGPIGGVFRGGANPFSRFPGVIGPPRGMFNRRGNSQRWFRGGNRGSRARRYPPEMEEQYQRYFSKFLNERNMYGKREERSPHRSSRRTRSRSRSRSRSKRRSYSRSTCSRSRSRRRSSERKSRSYSSRSRSKSRSTYSRSRSKESYKRHSGSSRKSEVLKDSHKQNSSKDRNSHSRENVKQSKSSEKSEDVSTTPKQRMSRSRSKS